jgi:hypothetical protein
MQRAIITLATLAALTSCSRWDEASERAACEKGFPGDKAGADDCYQRNKLMYDKDMASRAAEAKR